MEILVLLLLILLIMLACMCRIKSQNTIFRKIRMVLAILAVMVSMLGIITPFNFVYFFLCSYILLFLILGIHLICKKMN